jgi:predicted AlkP superfamily phosphohydrolase/phosphomutase
MSPDPQRVLVVGIDGGTFDVIRPLIQEGELPNLAALMTEGVIAELRSTVPPISAPAWISFMTGKNPGKHGFFDFVGNTHRTYVGNALSFADLKVQTLWSILSKHGKRLILLNVPMTYPPAQVNGVVVSGLGAPLDAQDITFPAGVYDELREHVGEYEIDQSIERRFDGQIPSPSSLEDLIQRLHRMTEKRTEAALFLLRNHPWDLFMVVYVMTDRLQHLFWKYRDPSHPDYDQEFAARFGRAISDGYRKVDEAIGRIHREVGDNVTAIVMSDHGSGPLHECFFVNAWLLQRGYLTLKRTLPWRFRATRAPLHRILSRLRLASLTRLLPERINRLGIPRVKRIPKGWQELIDWSRTRAYASGVLGIDINVRGREPHGIVNPGEECEALLQELTRELRGLRHPVTGEPMVHSVMRKEEVYAGPFVEDATDLIFAMQGMQKIPHSRHVTSRRLFGPPPIGWSGAHRFEGILTMRGPKVRQGASLRQAQIADLAPTILCLFGLPIPRDMDGRVLEEAIDLGVLASHPVTYTHADGQNRERDNLAPLTGEDEERVREHLRNLGYLS